MTCDSPVCLSAVHQDYYPERLGTALVLNASLIFRMMWAVISPFLVSPTCQLHSWPARVSVALIPRLRCPGLPCLPLPTSRGGTAREDPVQGQGPLQVSGPCPATTTKLYVRYG